MENDQASSWLDEGLAHHQAGRSEDAANCYGRILDVDPRHPDALHLLGVLAHQAGDYARAVRLIGEAAAIDPDAPEYLNNLGEAYRAAGRPAEAADAYLRALTLEPRLVTSVLGLAASLQSTGRAEEAVDAWERALALDPGHPDTLNNLGVALERVKRVDDAVARFRQAKLANNESFEATANLSRALAAAEKFDEAVELAAEAARMRPGDVGVRVTLGATLSDAGRYAEALHVLRDAALEHPDRVECHFALGCVFECSKEYAGAALAFAKCVSLNPKLHPAITRLGNALLRNGKLDEAIVHFERAVEIAPSFFEGRLNLAGAYFEAHRLDDAIAAGEAARALRPDDAPATILLATLLVRRGEQTRADELFQEALRRAPEHPHLLGNYAGLLIHRAETDRALEVFARMLRLNPDDAAYHSNLLLYLNGMPDFGPERVFQEHVDWGRRHTSRLETLGPLAGRNADPHRKLRIGYVSADWRLHSVAYFMLPILAAHDHSRHTIVVYDSVASPDRLTHAMRRFAEEWYRVAHLDDERLARKIRDDQIDVLVDLSGHTGGSRLLAFARRPAPVQVSYVGYPNTTGVAAMDYRLTDDVADPPGDSDAHHTEQLIRLPRCFLCYHPPGDVPDRNRPAAAAAIVAETPAFRFCSFNAITKYNQPMVNLWCRVLLAVPGSKIVLKANGLGDVGTRAQVAAMFADAGVEEDRLELIDRAPTYTGHLEHYNQCDLALDTFPYNGTTTTCEALWMGVPVVTRYGDRHASRVGGSLLTAVGLPELIARSDDEFVRVATELAADVPRLTALRRGMRERMAGSPLMDAAGHTARLEDAYRLMWTRWCATQGGPGRAEPTAARHADK